jgi:hypothetical protein
MNHAITATQTKLTISEEIPNSNNPDQPDIHPVCIGMIHFLLFFYLFRFVYMILKGVNGQK